MTRTCLFVSLIALVLTAARPADDIEMPESLQDFWGRYYPAALEDDLEAMDRAVRLNKDDAIDALELLLDDLALTDDHDLHGVVRSLAWSLDRLEKSERFITRVRWTLDRDVMERRKRRRAKDRLWDVREVVAEATRKRDKAALGRQVAALVEVSEEFESIGADEYAFEALVEAAEIRRQLGEAYEQSKLLARALEIGEDLPFRFDRVGQVEALLEDLARSGIDPDGPRPEEGAEAGAEADLPPGTSLESFADGAEWETAELEPIVAKKGVISGVALPSFHPIDNFFLWPFSFLEGIGPAEFDSHKQIFAPRDQRWQITRDDSTYTIDPTGDGSLAVEFTPSSTPDLVEIPLSDDKDDVVPLMISVPSNRELLFGIEVNYSPQPGNVRLRYNIAGWREGEALGETWKIYDTNLSGRYGDTWEYIDDLITKVDDEVPTRYIEVDAVQIGRSKVALPWSTVIPFDDTFYRAEIDPDGTELKLRELELATGEIELEMETDADATHVVIRALGEELEGAFFNIVPERRGRGVKVPVGTYELAMGRLEDGKRNSMDQVRIYPGTLGEITVTEGETTTLEFGEPYTLTVDSRPEGDEVYVDGRSIRVFGRSGEEYACLFDEALRPEISIVDAEGKTIVRPDNMLQADISAWQNNDRNRDNVLWFPLDVRLEKPRVSDYRVHLYQKDHPLLGGPLETATPED